MGCAGLGGCLELVQKAAGEMAKQLKTLTALTEVLSSDLKSWVGRAEIVRSLLGVLVLWL